VSGWIERQGCSSQACVCLASHTIGEHGQPSECTKRNALIHFVSHPFPHSPRTAPTDPRVALACALTYLMVVVVCLVVQDGGDVSPQGGGDGTPADVLEAREWLLAKGDFSSAVWGAGGCSLGEGKEVVSVPLSAVAAMAEALGHLHASDTSGTRLLFAEVRLVTELPSYPQTHRPTHTHTHTPTHPHTHALERMCGIVGCGFDPPACSVAFPQRCLFFLSFVFGALRARNSSVPSAPHCNPHNIFPRSRSPMAHWPALVRPTYDSMRSTLVRTHPLMRTRHAPPPPPTHTHCRHLCCSPRDGAH
jgi:hypothetical protein